jgi:hypothetical protein
MSLRFIIGFLLGALVGASVAMALSTHNGANTPEFGE